ncbi:MAG: hypothetical protein IJZ75_05060 [Clostridia bacterium]|nr:hypothetical protein [Clostridia bacterium]
MGFSVPSTPYIVELSHLFNVSTDYLLGVDDSASVDVNGLTDLEIAAVVNIVDRLKEGHKIK